MVAERIVRSPGPTLIAAMSSPEMVAIQMRLQASADQLQTLSNALDMLRHERGGAIVDLRRLLAARYPAVRLAAWSAN